MADLCGYASRPLAFIFRYVRLRPFSHAVILAAVLSAVVCSVSTQYGVKHLVDVLSSGVNAGVWTAFLLLGSLIAADNLLWRVAAWISNFAFVGVTGDYGGTCSVTLPGIRRATLPIAFRACSQAA